MRGLYEILPRTNGLEGANAFEGAFEVQVAAEHAVFGGHFPGNPVLPGVCTMMIVRECASLAAGRPLRYAAVGECKFTAAIAPGDLLTVELRLAAEGAESGNGAEVTGGTKGTGGANGAEGADGTGGGCTLAATVRTGEVNALKIKAKLTPDE